MEFPISFDHHGRHFTLSIGTMAGTMALFPRDAGRVDVTDTEPVVVLEVDDDPTRYACGDPERYRDAEVLIARVSLWYHTLKPSGRPATPPATRPAVRRR